MNGRYLDPQIKIYPFKALAERGRVMDIRDDKWAHPYIRECASPWDMSEMNVMAVLYDTDVPREQKVEIGRQASEQSAAFFGAGNIGLELCNIDVFEVPGCPEEPDAPATVEVYRPKSLAKKKARCMFYIPGGALTMCEPVMYPIGELCERYGCIAVVPRYRTAYQAQYPGAINDLHAAYQWALDNATTIGIDPKNIVIHGVSTGAQLALALGFRLMRYGLPNPKGIVAMIPQTDDRQRDGVQILNGSWDSYSQHDALACWLGRDFASSSVGPEALANHATVEECVGYPPTVIHTVEFDPDRDFCREFYGKLLQAKTYAEFHAWPAAHHSSMWYSGVAMNGELNEYSKRVKVVFDANMEDFWNFDMSRPWVVEE